MGERPNTSGYLGMKVRNSSEFKSWDAMMQRCYRESDRCFPIYGGRGILVCERWHNFFAFREDMGPRPNGHSLDRINPDGNYEPSNCRWATLKDQARNKRNNRRIELNGETRTLIEWGEAHGVSPDIISHRLASGWTKERAITTQARRGYRQYSGFGKTQGARQWADEYGYPCQVILDRMRSGWTIERAVTTPVGNFRGARPNWWKSRYGYRIGDEGHENYKTDEKEQQRDE